MTTLTRSAADIDTPLLSSLFRTGAFRLLRRPMAADRAMKKSHRLQRLNRIPSVRQAPCALAIDQHGVGNPLLRGFQMPGFRQPIGIFADLQGRVEESDLGKRRATINPRTDQEDRN